MSERYQREIEEILKEVVQKPAKKPRRHRGFRPRLANPFRGLTTAITPGKLLMTSVALLLTALLVRRVAPGLVGLLFWAGLLLFIAAYAFFFVRWGSGPKRRWRGRPLDDDVPRYTSWWRRLLQWLRQ